MGIDLEDNSKEFIQALNDMLPTTLEALGLQGEANAKLLCPVDTGRLRNSLTHTRDDNAAYIGTNVEYAAYVELGTSKSKAQPYLRPAIEDHTDEYKRIIETYMKQG